VQERVLDWLVCPVSKTRLTLTVTHREGDEIMQGELVGETGLRYPIRAGVPRMIAGQNSTEVDDTVGNFGWQWQTFHELLPPEVEREQFLEWVAPLSDADFVGQVVLDAGCGMGRWSEAAAGLGAREVFAVDLGAGVEPAFRRLRSYENVHVIQADIMALPFRTGSGAPFDLAYSLGVIHHMPDPKAGFQSYLSHVRSGGTVLAWVYGAENNGWIIHGVNPIRRHITSRLSPPVLHALSRVLSVPLHGAAKVVHRRGVRDRFAYGPYLDWLGQFSFLHTHVIVHDHLTPGIASYHTREEVESWAVESRLSDARVVSRNNNSWRLLGKVS